MQNTRTNGLLRLNFRCNHGAHCALHARCQRELDDRGSSGGTDSPTFTMNATPAISFSRFENIVHRTARYNQAMSFEEIVARF